MVAESVNQEESKKIRLKLKQLLGPKSSEDITRKRDKKFSDKQDVL